MLLRKVRSFPTTKRTNILLYCANSYCAFTSENGSITVLRLYDRGIGTDSDLNTSSQQLLSLTGHHSVITSLTIHPARPELCSAASDYVITWNLDSAYVHHAAGTQIRGKVIASGLGLVSYTSFSYYGSRVAACTDTAVHVVDSKTATTECVLECNGNVTCAEFSPHYLEILVSAAEDRTFKVWDLEKRCVLYKSTIISSSPFISLAMRLTESSFALGTMDGIVRLYDISGETGYRVLHQIDLSKMQSSLSSGAQALSKGEGPPIIDSRPSWQRRNRVTVETAETAETEHPVLAIRFFEEYDSNSEGVQGSDVFSPHDEKGTRKPTATMLVGTSCGVFTIDIKTQECRSFVSLLDTFAEGDSPINMIGRCSFGDDTNNNQVYCIVSSLFEPKVHLLVLELVSEYNMLHGGITVLSHTPLHHQSPLRAELRPKTDEKTIKPKSSITYKPGNISGTLDKKGRICDKQPIVVRNRIKSSGYGNEAPRSVMFKPQTSVTKSKRQTPITGKLPSADCGDGLLKYPVDYSAPFEYRTKINVDTTPVAINSLRFRGDGQQLCCTLLNGIAHVYNLPLSTDKVTSIVGHSTVVLNSHWSQDHQWLLTSSEQCACVHNLSQKEPAMVIDRVRDNFDIDREGGTKMEENPAFSKPVRQSQFYFMDRFILLASGNSIIMYKYHLDPTKSELKRYLTRSRYKLVTSLGLQNAHAVTSLSAVNSFYSYIVIGAGSDKSIELFDMNVGRSVRMVTNCHSKPVHALVQYEGSAFCSGGNMSYDTFLTAAVGDGIKLWDIRANRCVQLYEGHCSRAHVCGLAFSPCGRFFATGAEDKSAYMYDMRQSTYAHKLTGHTDVVSDVAFSPRTPQLYTATLDGQIRVFAPS